jgi:hypothetical protein
MILHIKRYPLLSTPAYLCSGFSRMPNSTTFQWTSVEEVGRQNIGKFSESDRDFSAQKAE